MPRRSGRSATTVTKSTSQQSECCTADVKRPKPPLIARVSANANRSSSLKSTNSSRKGSSSVPQQQQQQQQHANSSSRNNLEDLELAFHLLARQIQGLDGEEGQYNDEDTHPAIVARSSANVCTPNTTTNVEKPIQTDRTENESTTLSGPLPSEHPALFADALEASKKRANANESDAVPLVAGRPVPAKARQARSYSRGDDGTPVLQKQHGGDGDALKLARAAGFAEGKNIMKTVAREAKQALKRLQAELEMERRSREAAESALQDLQLRAAECSIEREKLIRVVNSFGGHSLQEVTTESQQLERRALEAEKSLAEAHMIANQKTAEALDTLERAADLGEALDKETAARVVAEDSKRTLTQDLRACLRNRAKAEEAASVASRALTKSEAQRESLGQRLEVLRAENKRLGKRRSAAAGVARVVGVIGGAETGERLAAARARLRSLSVSNLNSGASGGGCGNKGDAEIAAIERAMKAAAVEKRWEERLHKAKAWGEAYKTTAEAAETGMQRAVREKVELEKVNRVLAKNLDERSRDAASGRAHRHSGKTVVASGKRDSGASGASNLHEQDAMVRHDQASASESDLPGRTGGANDTERKKCPSKARFLSIDDTGLSPPTHCSSDLALTESTAAAATAAPSGRTHVGGFTAQATTSRERETQTLPLGTRLETARSYSADGVCGSGLPLPNGRHHARPRSTSEANRLSDHDALDKASEEPIKTLSDNCAAPYDQLLLQSRQLREESLSAVRQGPWGDKTQAICSAAPTPKALQPQLQPEVQTQGTLRASCTAGARIDPVASVPIDVLLRLCGRSAHGGRGETSEDIALDAINRATTYSQVVEEDMEEEGESLGRNRGLPQPVTQPGGVHDVVLPAGISATLAEQVQGAVSRGDERSFLQIVGRCGSTARGGISQLLSIAAP